MRLGVALYPWKQRKWVFPGDMSFSIDFVVTAVGSRWEEGRAVISSFSH